jgi:eukaryotic-like serine/threonine-protein kinase
MVITSSGLVAEGRSVTALGSFGDYELLEEIAAGGMGIVYKARQRSLDRLVAIKTLLFGPQAKPEFIKRFHAEATAAASLQHPHIVAIHEVGVHEGQHFFVMDYVEGQTLAELVSQKPLPAERAARYVKSIAEAIHYAHERGLLHRDLKPSNVLIDAQDQPRVTDFGLAKRFEGDSELTLSGQVVGSPGYLPPEQAEAKRGKVSRRSDVYGLGAILYHLLTGRPPFQAETLTDVLHQVLNSEPLAPRLLNPSIPRDLETICLKCLEKEAARRYPTAQMVAEELGRFLASETVLARPVGPAGKTWRWCRRKPVVASLAASVVIVSFVGLAGVLWQWQRARQMAGAEARQRKQAEANAYAADMNLAQQALLADDLGKAQSLLARYGPGTGLEHLRGFEWRYLAAEARSDMPSEDVSSKTAIFRAAFSPDGRTLAVGRRNGGVELWDASTLGRIAVLETNGHGAVAFAPGTNLLAVSGPDEVIRLWQLEPRRVVRELPSSSSVACLSFSSDGRYLAFWEVERGACLWDLRTLQLARRYPDQRDGGDHTGKVCFSPDGRCLVLGDLDGQIRFLELETDREVMRIAAHKQAISSLAFSPDGKVLASASGYRTDEIRLWNVATGDSIGSLSGHRAWVSALHFRDNRHLYSAGADQTIRFWDVAARRLERTLHGHTLAFSNQRTNFISECADGTLAWWPLDPPPSRSQQQELLTDARFLGYVDEAKVALRLNEGVLQAPGSIALWRPGKSQDLEVVPALGTNNVALATAPLRGLLAAASPGIIRIWSPASARLVTNLVADATGLRFSRSGESLLSFDAASRLFTVWDAQTWTKRFSHALSDAEASSFQRGHISPDGRWLVIVHSSHICWWDTVLGRQVVQASAHQEGVSFLDFSPDGKTLAISDWGGTVVLWDTGTQTQMASWKADWHAVTALAFSPDGTRLATALSDGRAARVWDVGTRRELITLHAPGQFFPFVGFSPDGSAFLAGEGTGHAYVWRPPSFAELDAAAKASTGSVR